MPARLLVVDDEATILELLSGSLRLAGFEVVTAASGFEAVAIQHEMDHLDGVLFLDRVASIERDVFRRKA